MTRYRRRYLTASDFSSYCKELNLELRTLSQSSSNAELEMYERDQILFPAARIVKADEYVVKRYELDQKTETHGTKIPEWYELERLLHRRPILDNNANSELWHPFDWEFERNNSFLFRPKEQQFKPWGEYRAKVKASEFGSMRKTAEHYYHYFQVHQIYAIQRRFPVYAKQNWLIENVNENLRDRAKHLTPNKDSLSITLEGHFDSFNALSFYITLYDNEQDRIFENIPEQDGVKTLDNQQYTHYTSQIKAHAQFILGKFDLNTDKLYEFLFYLLKLHNEYERNEYLKLANELYIDIQYLISFIQNIVDLSINEIEKEVDQRSHSYWTREFRHLDKAVKLYDYAKGTFERLLTEYNAKFPNLTISATDIENLIDFIETHGLFIIPYAIFDMDEALNDSRPFQSTSLYTNLSNLTTGFENYLREIANIASQSNIGNLHKIIAGMFPWGNDFNTMHETNITLYGKDDPFSYFPYLEDVYTDPNLDTNEALRTFLIAYRTRNMIAHNYTLDHKLYYAWYSVIYISVCQAILYAWVNATNNGWV